MPFNAMAGFTYAFHHGHKGFVGLHHLSPSESDLGLTRNSLHFQPDLLSSPFSLPCRSMKQPFSALTTAALCCPAAMASEAYKLARGGEITSSNGLPVKLGRPLD